MSTNINITVGDNALLDRAKQQQAANRQAQLNRENSTRLEAQATDERTKAQAASGKDANGNPLYGVPTSTPQIDRRPAANRQGYGALLAGPFAYSNYGGSDTGLTVRCQGNRNVAGARFSYEQNTAYPEGVVTAGPTENTQTLEATDTLGPLTVVLYTGQSQTTGEIISWQEQWAIEAISPSLKCVYAVQNGQYNTVLNWQIESGIIPVPPYNVVNLSENLVPVSGFRPLNNTKSFTHEFIMRMPTITLQDGPSRTYGFTHPQSLNKVFSTECRTLISFAGLTISVGAEELWQDTGGIILLFTDGPAGTPIDEVRIIRQIDRTSVYYAECLIRNPNFTTSDGQSLNGTTARPGFSNVGAFALPAATLGSFVHFALTRYPVGSGHRWSMFVNGVQLISGIIEPANWATTYGTQPPSVDVRIENRGPKFSRDTLPSVGVHAVRFTPKVLYTNNFTPPSTITRFA